MGSSQGRQHRDYNRMTTGTREELRVLAQRATTAGANDRQAMAALERYLQTPTFRRQGRQLSCR